MARKEPLDARAVACATCGRHLPIQRTKDSVKAPRDGAYAVCTACASVSIYCDGASRLRVPTAAELVGAYSIPSLSAALLYLDTHRATT